MKNGFTKPKVEKNIIGRGMDWLLGRQTGGFTGQVNKKRKIESATMKKFNGTDNNTTATKRAAVKDRVIKNRGQ